MLVQWGEQGDDCARISGWMTAFHIFFYKSLQNFLVTEDGRSYSRIKGIVTHGPYVYIFGTGPGNSLTQ